MKRKMNDQIKQDVIMSIVCDRSVRCELQFRDRNL